MLCASISHSCLPNPLFCTFQQEFQAEQDYMKTLSYLSPEEQKIYKERQSVSWLYQKPPGMDAADKPKVICQWCTPHRDGQACKQERAASDDLSYLCRRGRLIRANRQL